MTEAIGKQLGNFFGSFVQYDSNNNSSIWREYMRLCIKVDVRNPLKRKKKICRKDKSEVIVQCKYEKLGDFCFVCGLLSHTERFCPKKHGVGSKSVSKDWGSWLRAPPRRSAGGSRSKWLREEGDDSWGSKFGNDAGKERFSGFQNPDYPRSDNNQPNKRNNIISKVVITGDKDYMEINSNLEKGNVFQKLTNGPEEEELNGLKLEERKRQRIEAHEF